MKLTLLRSPITSKTQSLTCPSPYGGSPNLTIVPGRLHDWSARQLSTGQADIVRFAWLELKK